MNVFQLRKVKRLSAATALVSCLVLADAGSNAYANLIPPEQRTTGVNYDPYIDQELLSSSELDFHVLANFGGMPVELVANDIQDTSTVTVSPLGLPKGYRCGSGCRRAAYRSASDDLVADVFILRFGKTGRSDLPSGGGFDWTITMQEGSTLTGSLTVPTDAAGQPDYPGTLSLSGNMVISILPDGASTPINLRSRINPILEGTVTGWPPYDAQIELTNGPIPYYNENEIDDPNAIPILEVTENTATLGPEPSLFFSTIPEIIGSARLDLGGSPWSAGPIGGVELTWTDTSDTSTPPVSDFYHLYTNITPNDLNAWTLLASLPSDQTSFVDPSYTGTRDINYLVMHSINLPMGYYCEGFYDTPTTVEAVPEPNVLYLFLLGSFVLCTSRINHERFQSHELSPVA